jgi:hypothetical protein
MTIVKKWNREFRRWPAAGLRRDTRLSVIPAFAGMTAEVGCCDCEI